MGRIGENGQEFLIGSRFAQKMNSSGQLYLANNDTVADDNSGAINVVVECTGCGDVGRDVTILPVPVPPNPNYVPENPGPGIDAHGDTEQRFKVSSRYISGDGQWLDSGIDVRRNARLLINAKGRWRINTWGKAVDANGGGDYAEYGRYSYGALVGRIGENGRTFLIGANYDKTARQGGRLYFANNDDVAEDNEGELIVSVSCDRCGSQHSGSGGNGHSSTTDGQGEVGPQGQVNDNQPSADFLISRKWRMVDEAGYLVAKRVVLRRNGSVRLKGATQDTGIESWRMEGDTVVLLNGSGQIVNRFRYDGSPGGQAVFRGRGSNSRQANYVLIENR